MKLPLLILFICTNNISYSQNPVITNIENTNVYSIINENFGDSFESNIKYYYKVSDTLNINYKSDWIIYYKSRNKSDTASYCKVVNGVNHISHFYLNGKIKAIEEYVNNSLVTKLEYCTNGTLMFKKDYRLKNNIDTLFTCEGNILAIINYINNTSTHYYRNGKIESIDYFSTGFNGIKKKFSKKGKKIKCDCYINGELMFSITGKNIDCNSYVKPYR